MVKTLLLALVFSQQSFAQLQCGPLTQMEHRWVNHQDPAKIYRSSEHPSGAYIVSAFYANCPACNQSQEVLRGLYHDYRDQVEVLSVGRDCRIADYQRWIGLHQPEHPVLDDCDMRTLGRLGTRSYPTTFLLDCNLKLIHATSGPLLPEMEDEFRRRLDELLLRGCTQNIHSQLDRRLGDLEEVENGGNRSGFQP